MSRLLKKADEAADGSSSALPTGLEIRTLARQRMRRRNIATSVSLIVIACGISAIAVKTRSGADQVSSHSTAGVHKPSQTVLRPGTVDLDVRQRIALEAQIRLDHQHLAMLSHNAPRVDLAQQREQTARYMVMMAGRRSELAGRQEAADLYARAIALFPETQSAALARQALGGTERQN